MRIEADALTNPVASAPGVVSLVPNPPALEAMVLGAGFSRIELREARPHHNKQYRDGDRVVLIAWPLARFRHRGQLRRGTGPAARL